MKEKKGEGAVGAERVIKKYPNRRLYDTHSLSALLALYGIQSLPWFGKSR